MNKRAYFAVTLFIVGFVLVNLLVFYVLTYAPTVTGRLQGALTGFSPVERMVIVFLTQELILLALLWGAMNYWRPAHTVRGLVRYFERRRKRKGRRAVWTYVVGGLIVYFCSNILLALLVAWVGVDIPGLYGEQMTMSMLQQLPLLRGSDYIFVAILVAALGPFIEELIYRGFITDVLMRSRGGWGVTLAAALFALAHLERGVILNLFILSLFLGYIYYKTESLWYSFLFHVIINGLAVSVMFIARLYPELTVAFVF